MKIRAKANGDVITVSDDTAKELIEAGIYEAVDEKAPAGPPTVLTKMAKPITARRRRP